MRSIVVFRWKFIAFLAAAFVLSFIPSTLQAQGPHSSITLDNQSGQDAVVKIIGPSGATVNVPNKEKRTVTVSGGEYYILTQYLKRPGEYVYSKGERFDVLQTAMQFSTITITLHPVKDGNYSTHRISAAEFESRVPSIPEHTGPELKNPILTPIQKAIPQMESAKLKGPELATISPMTEPVKLKGPDLSTISPMTEVAKLHPHVALSPLADQNKASVNREKALIAAAYEGDSLMVRTLLSKGANVDCQDEDSQTPLWVASLQGHAAVVKMLLDNAADANRPGKHGLKILEMTAREGHETVVELLLAHGAEVNYQYRKDETGTPLMMASLLGHEKVVRVLLANGANPLLQAHSGYSLVVKGVTALIDASFKGHARIVQILLEKGAEVNHQQSDGVSALYWASEKGHVEVVKILLAYGADVSLQSNKGMTALSVAKTERIVQQLKAAGAK